MINIICDSRLVCKRMKLLLDHLNLSQHEFAMLIDSTDSAVSRYLSGERIPTTMNLIRIAQATKISPNWILGYGADDVIESIKTED